MNGVTPLNLNYRSVRSQMVARPRRGKAAEGHHPGDAANRTMRDVETDTEATHSQPHTVRGFISGAIDIGRPDTSVYEEVQYEAQTFTAIHGTRSCAPFNLPSCSPADPPSVGAAVGESQLSKIISKSL